MASGFLNIALSLTFLGLAQCARPVTNVGRNTDPCTDRITAICRIRNGTVNGDVTIEQISSTSARISGSIIGLARGDHGFHVHLSGDLSNGCANAGGHYNPFNMTHGAPSDNVRHVGDLGNIQGNGDDASTISITDDQIRLCGRHSVIGRAIVVHERRDDLGQGGNEESLRTGNAGARIGCCTIAYC